jgi:hypothetical protein
MFCGSWRRRKYSSVALGVVTVGLTAGLPSRAAIAYTGNVYTQSFDAFAGAAGTVAFANDSTITGFSAYLSGGASATAGAPDVIARNSGTTSASAATSTFASGATYPFYFYRPAASDTNVSFAFFNTDATTAAVGTGYLAAGFALRNDTGTVLNSFSLSYTAAASTTALTNTDAVTVSYAVNATGVADADGSYTVAPGLGYSVSAAGVLTGPTETTVAGVTINPGDTLYVRFKDVNVGGTDRLSRIDNVAIVVPEPAAVSSVGLAVTGLAARRRRRAAR